MFPQSFKIMIVDDSSAMRQLIKKELTALGYTKLSMAPDGDEARDLLLESLETEPFDLVLADCKMPGTDGLELLKFIRGYEPLHTKTRVIMVTAESERATVLESLKAGAIGYLLKPFDQKSLRTCLERSWSFSEQGQQVKKRLSPAFSDYRQLS